MLVTKSLLVDGLMSHMFSATSTYLFLVQGYKPFWSPDFCAIAQRIVVSNSRSLQTFWVHRVFNQESNHVRYLFRNPIPPVVFFHCAVPQRESLAEGLFWASESVESTRPLKAQASGRDFVDFQGVESWSPADPSGFKARSRRLGVLCLAITNCFSQRAGNFTARFGQCSFAIPVSWTYPFFPGLLDLFFQTPILWFNPIILDSVRFKHLTNPKKWVV